MSKFTSPQTNEQKQQLVKLLPTSLQRLMEDFLSDDPLQQHKIQNRLHTLQPQQKKKARMTMDSA